MFRTLFIINIKSFLADIIKLKSFSRGKKALIAFTLGMIGFSFFSMFLLMFGAIVKPYFATGLGWMYFSFLSFLIFTLCLFSTIFTTSSRLFHRKDNETLLAMPIKPHIILASRLAILLIMEYFFSLTAAAAAFIPWLREGYATPRGAAIFIPETLLLPPMALAVSMAFSWALNFAALGKRRKNSIVLAVSLGFIFGIMYLNLNAQRYLNELVARKEEIASAFRKVMPPFYAFGKSVVETSWPYIVEFIIWAVIPFATIFALIAPNYRKTLMKQRGSPGLSRKARYYKGGSPLAALVLKELAYFWSKPMVILNTCMGSCFMAAGGVALIMKGTAIKGYAAGIIPQGSSVNLASLAAGALTLLSSYNNISSSLISLEGKTLWITKSIPLPAKTILQSKLLVHIIVSGAPCLGASIIAGIVAAKSLLDWLTLILTPQSFIALSAILGITLNLKLPKFDWANEVTVVKQSLSAMLALLGGNIILALMGALFLLLLRRRMSLEAFLLLTALAFAAAGILAYRRLMKAGARRFGEL